MPYIARWEDDGFVREFYGVVNSSEVLESDREFYEDPRSDTAKYQITDFSNAQPGDVDYSHITKIAALDAGASITLPNLKVAFVTSDEYVKVLCEKYIELSLAANETWKFRIFEDMVSARWWVS
jgi:hypothetical protein